MTGTLCVLCVCARAEFLMTAIIDNLIDHRLNTILSTLPARVSAHALQFSCSPSPYVLSDLIENDKFINTICNHHDLIDSPP